MGMFLVFGNVYESMKDAKCNTKEAGRPYPGRCTITCLFLVFPTNIWESKTSLI